MYFFPKRDQFEQFIFCHKNKTTTTQNKYTMSNSAPSSSSPKRLRLQFCCRNVFLNANTQLPVSPYAVLFEGGAADGTQQKEVGRTERLVGTNNPNFLCPVEIDFYFEKRQMLTFVIFDSSASASQRQQATPTTSIDAVLGIAKFQLSQIVVSGGGATAMGQSGKEFPLITPSGQMTRGFVVVSSSDALPNQQQQQQVRMVNGNNVNAGTPPPPMGMGPDGRSRTNSFGVAAAAAQRLGQTFTQSLASGWQINMALSIDFTGSNGDPHRPTSLHYMDPQRPNQYIAALMSVGDILMEYDDDKRIPVFGFGASFRGQTSHFFHVNMQHDPYVSGVQGAINAYGQFLPTAILDGPTNFAPTVLNVTKMAREAERNRVYTILLMITDGDITDLPETIQALVAADDAPLSIIVVGVGNSCDFEMMQLIDGDGMVLQDMNGRSSRRDLVQFVPYRDFLPPKPREALAAEVLREIPSQFEQYLVLANQRGAQYNATANQQQQQQPPRTMNNMAGPAAQPQQFQQQQQQPQYQQQFPQQQYQQQQQQQQPPQYGYRR